MRINLFLSVLIALCLFAVPTHAGLLYSQDFETGSAPSWTLSGMTVSSTAPIFGTYSLNTGTGVGNVGYIDFPSTPGNRTLIFWVLRTDPSASMQLNIGLSDQSSGTLSDSVGSKDLGITWSAPTNTRHRRLADSLSVADYASGLTANTPYQVRIDYFQHNNTANWYTYDQAGSLIGSSLNQAVGTGINTTRFYITLSSGGALNYKVDNITIWSNSTIEPVLELGLSARNVVNQSLVSGLCVLATGTNTTQNLCNATGTSVSFNTTGLYNISFYSLGVGDNASQTYFNASVQNYNFSVTATLEANTSQALLAVSAYKLFLNTSITTFNATNNQAFNSTAGGSLLLPANNGSNSVQVQVPGNYSLNTSCPVSAPLSTVTCDATGVYDGRYEFNATDARNGTAISTFNVTLSNASINASSINTTTNGNATFNLLQGYTYNFTFRGPGYATQSKILPSNASYHKYEFRAFTTNSVNISFYDEETGVFLSTTNVSVDFISDVESRNETAINGTLFVDLLTPANYTLRYSAPGYFTRFYEFELFDNTFNSLNLTLLNSTTGEEVTINVKDTLNNPIEGALVRIHKYDITTNTYPLIEVVTTNFEGQTLASLVLNDEFYKFIIEVDGEVVLETSSTQIYGTELTFVVDIGAITGFGEAFTQFQLSGDVSYLNNSHQFDFTYVDASNTATQACLYVYTLGDEKELYNSTCTSSPSGTILVGILNETGTFYQAIGVITVGGINYTIDTEYASFGELLPEDGSGLFMMMVMVIIFATAAAASIELAIVVSSGVPFLFVLMGMVRLDYTVTLALFAGGVVLAFIFGVIRR